MKKPWRHRISLVLAGLGALATTVNAAQQEFPRLWFLDVLISAGIWLGIGQLIGWIVDKARQVPNPKARIGDKAPSWYLSQIPESASVPEKLERLIGLREDRRISQSDFDQAKLRLIGPAIAKPAPPTSSTATQQADMTPSSGPLPASQVPPSRPPSSSPASAGGATNSESIATELRRLKELRDEGLLTEDEYKSKRKLLADRL